MGGEFNAQELASMAWSFASAGSDVPLFGELARAARRVVNAQHIASTAWAFALVGEPVPILDATLVPEAQDVQGLKMSMQCLARSGEVVAGCGLLAWAGASGLLSLSGDNCYSMFRALLEACRAVSDPERMSQVQAAAERVGLSAHPPV